MSLSRRDGADEMLDFGERRAVLQVIVGADGGKILIEIVLDQLCIHVTLLKLNRDAILVVNDQRVIDGAKRLELERVQ